MIHIFPSIKPIRLIATLTLAALLCACTTVRPSPSGQASISQTNALKICPEKKIITSTADYDALTFSGFGNNFSAFHKANGMRDGVTTTPSGLQYSVVQKGLKDGASPAKRDEVTVHYHGYFADGEIFDSSYQRGTPSRFPVNAVIDGWTEALQNMTLCEARTLYIPGNLAYGRKGTSAIAPNSTLFFDVQLLAVD